MLLIRINQRYRHGMSARELYEATRGIWKLSPSHAEQASYAFAVFEGIVREVYAIDKWHPAGIRSTKRGIWTSTLRARSAGSSKVVWRTTRSAPIT